MLQRHTVSYLSKILAAGGAHPKHRFGQNFLIDLNLIELIVKHANLSKQDVVLEIGTGSGSLTSYLVQSAGHVISVEIDREMFAIASEELSQSDNLTLLGVDALETKNKISGEVLATLSDQMSKLEHSQLKLVANLPYNIATPLIANLWNLENPPVQMVVTVQLELAERLVAMPSTKNYGAVSIWIQSQADCDIVRKLSPKVFWPSPKVESAILNIALNRQRRASIDDLQFYHKFVRNMFLHRRKRIASQLSSAVNKNLTSEQIQQLFQDVSIDSAKRAEELSTEQFIALANAVGKL